MPAMRALINEGLRQRQEHGVAAALAFFEEAAQLEPDSYLPLFMLGNAAGELGDLDAAALHFSRARDLQPNEYVIRFNLGLNQISRGYVEAGIEELRAACSLNPDYLPAQSAYILALHNSDHVGQEDIAATIREWGLFPATSGCIPWPISLSLSPAPTTEVRLSMCSTATRIIATK